MTVFITYEELKKKPIKKMQKATRILVGKRISAVVDELLQQEVSGEEVWLYHPFLEEAPQRMSFEMLLLDERYADGYINIPAAAFKECGYLNEGLEAKQEYEFLLRLGEKYPVFGTCGQKEQMLESWEMHPLENRAIDVKDAVETSCDVKTYKSAFYAFQTDCYIVGKYSAFLQKQGYFNEVVTELIQQASVFDNEDAGVKWLEDMLGHGEAYWYIEDRTAPILIYYGVTYCYNILNVMLEQLAAALERAGERVLFYDEQTEDITGLSQYVGRRFKAVIGIQTYLMSIYMKESEKYLHDRIIGPKFNMILDHPVWLREQLEHAPKDYYVLTHDANYKKFVEQYYPKVQAAYLLPPGGIWQEPGTEEKKYGISFIGTYGDYRKKCEVIRQCIPKIKYRANRFLLYMRKNPELTAEQAFQKMLDYYGIKLTKQEFLQEFFEMRSVIQCVMYYYREKVIEILLKAGIQVDIWGSSWEESKWNGHSCLSIHEDISPEESLFILRQSAISLNVMAWHKGGFTERMANSMLAGAVLLTDETSYQKSEKKDDNYCVMFSLKRLEELPVIARKLLGDETWRKEMANRGYAYAREHHTWDCRARELLALIKQLETENIK